jgi:integrase
MFTAKLIDRFTYSKMSCFLKSMDAAESSCPYSSPEHMVIKRDKIFFQLCYSYGLRPTEVLNLKRNNLNFDKTDISTDAEYGSIFISNDKHQSRLVYSIYTDVILDILEYLDIYDIHYKSYQNRYLFHSYKGNPLSLRYMSNRLRYYNSRLICSNRIESLYLFRLYYITDLLRIKDIPQDFINRQIGNTVINNQVYYNIKI